MSVVGGYSTQTYHALQPGSHDLYYPSCPPSANGRTSLYSPPEHTANNPYFPGWMLGSPGELANLPTAADPASAYGSSGHEQLAMMMYDASRRGVKRRGGANKKERRRTHSINSAFASLRGCIPNVPSDTKLSKIKTLRLATSYIAYLMDVLSKEEVTEGGFKAELAKKIESREERRRREAEEMMKPTRAEKSAQNQHQQQQQKQQQQQQQQEREQQDKKNKGRTGWPQQVWAAELAS